MNYKVFSCSMHSFTTLLYSLGQCNISLIQNARLCPGQEGWLWHRGVSRRTQTSHGRGSRGEKENPSCCACVWRWGRRRREERGTARHTTRISSNLLRTEKGGGIQGAWEGEGRTAQSNRALSTCPFTSYRGQAGLLCATLVPATQNECPSPLRLIYVTSFQR